MTSTTPKSFSDLYAAYAAGCLDPAFAMMVETQSLLRPEIRQSVAVSEMISGTLLETAPEARLNDGALDRALPDPVRVAALDAIGRKGWQVMGRGLKRLTLETGSSMETELYRIAPGARIPRHSHAGSEYTLVVAGGFTDERGSYGPGDVIINGPDDCHQPVGDEGEVCYALAVRDGGLRFTGMIGVIQRLLGAQ